MLLFFRQHPLRNIIILVLPTIGTIACVSERIFRQQTVLLASRIHIHRQADGAEHGTECRIQIIASNRHRFYMNHWKRSCKIAHILPTAVFYAHLHLFFVHTEDGIESPYILTGQKGSGRKRAENRHSALKQGINHRHNSLSSWQCNTVRLQILVHPQNRNTRCRD